MTNRTRRHFLQDVLRGAALTALAAAGCWLSGRKSSLGNQACAGGGVCSRCNAFIACGLPAVLSAKAARREDQP